MDACGVREKFLRTAKVYNRDGLQEKVFGKNPFLIKCACGNVGMIVEAELKVNLCCGSRQKVHKRCENAIVPVIDTFLLTVN